MKIIETNGITYLEKFEALSVYDDLGIGIGIRFKYPFSHFEDSCFEKWDCGFINGAVIVRGLSIDDDLETE